MPAPVPAIMPSADGIIRVTTPVGVSIKTMFEHMAQFVADNAAVRDMRLLVDARQLVLGKGEHALLSHQMGQAFSRVPGVRIAVLAQEHSREGQLIGRQQGTDMRLFAADEEDFALEWLRES